MPHKDYCTYPTDPCSCGYEEPQKEHSSWCSYPSEPCNCGIGLSQYDIDHGERKEK